MKQEEIYELLDEEQSDFDFSEYWEVYKPERTWNINKHWESYQCIKTIYFWDDDDILDKQWDFIVFIENWKVTSSAMYM